MTNTDNRALWELVEKMTNLSRIMAGGDGTTRIDTPAWEHLLELTNELRGILERPVVVGDDSLVVRNPAPHASVPLVGTPQVTLNIGALGQPDSDWIIRRMHEKSFESGWCVACDWAERDDMISDIDSPAYKRDRDQSLESMVRGKS